MSVFSEIQAAAPIEVFAVNKAYLDCTHSNKVNLSIGAYRTSESKPWVLPVVRKVEKMIADDETINHEYLPILGMEAFSTAASKMLLGQDFPAFQEGRAFGIQTLSGTGALRVGSEFLCRVMKREVFYFSSPTWGNHKLVFNEAGFKDTRSYRYWDAENRCLDLAGMLEDFRNAPEGSVMIIHSCAHNPTGVDPTQDQWKQIADVMEEKKLFPFFDSAYQGFASGDLDKDAWAVRYFASRGFEMFCSQSYAKNFGLYNERIGNLTVLAKDTSAVANMKSQFQIVVRAMYSNPPHHGARVVSTVLNNPQLFEEWRECIRTMSGRIQEMRHALRTRLETLGTPGKWDHITSQIGMFSFTGLSPQQVEHMTKEHNVFLLKNGRVNICGLTPSNVEHVGNAMHDAITKFPGKL